MTIFLTLEVLFRKKGTSPAIPAIAILAAIGNYRLFKAGQEESPRKAAEGFHVVALLLTVLNIYSMYAAISLEERYLGHSSTYKKTRI